MLPSNQLQIEAALLKILKLGVCCVAVLGLSFKPGTDDLRESPVISLIRVLWQDGVDVLVYDPDIQLDAMLGSNREYLERQLPQINQILRTNINDVLNKCQVVVVSQKRSEFVAALQVLGEKNSSIVVLDLVRLSKETVLPGLFKYQGISWFSNDLADGHVKVSRVLVTLPRYTAQAFSSGITTYLPLPRKLLAESKPQPKKKLN